MSSTKLKHVFKIAELLYRTQKKYDWTGKGKGNENLTLWRTYTPSVRNVVPRVYVEALLELLHRAAGLAGLAGFISECSQSS